MYTTTIATLPGEAKKTNFSTQSHHYDSSFPSKMPITLQKKKHSRKGTKTENSSDNEDHSSPNKSFLSKIFSQIPATFIFLFIIFLWATSTIMISGSIVHVCVTSRKLNNNQLYCLTAGAGAKPSNDNYTFVDNAKPPPAVPLPGALSPPLISPSNPIKSSKRTDNVTHAPTILSPIIHLPVVKNDVKKSENLMKQISPPYASPPVHDTKNEEKVKVENNVTNSEVESQMEILRSYKRRKPVDYNDPDACDGNGIFVYDLPSKFNKDLVAQCSEMVSGVDVCKFLSHGAFGEPVSQLGNGWYNTHQYALEPIFHARVLKHPCRVNDPAEAKAFYVPFYGGLDILKSHFKESASNEIKDKLSQELIEWLEQQTFWKRNFGIDHVFVLGKVSWDFRRGKNATWGTQFLELDEMQNPIKLLLERHPWHSNDVAVPYPTFFHPTSDNDIVAWQTKIMQIPRKNLASFAGTLNPNAAKGIRSTVINQCTSSTECQFINCSEGQCSLPSTIMSLFMDSDFCLQPSGDSATRKSLIDSLLAGCIPVVFDPFTAHYQYPWHLPTDQSNYSVFIDGKMVTRGEVNVVDRLATVSAARRAEMRSYIVYEVMPGLVYADPEGKLERFEDAFSVAMSGVLQMMSKLL